VEVGDAVSEAVHDDVGVGEPLSLAVPLPVAVLLGVVAADGDDDGDGVAETVGVAGALGVPDTEAPLLSVAVGEDDTDGERLGVEDALRLLLGTGTPLSGRLLTWEALGATFRTLKVARAADCPACTGQPLPAVTDAGCAVGGR
jgi:hypothetical protein